MLSNLDSRRYIFIDVIGNPPAQHKKAGIGYHQISNGILIRDFAINILKSYDVKILAYGNGEYYNNFHGMNNKYYFQIDIENIFQIDLHSQIDFDYYNDFKDLLEKIENMISINEYSSVILFLDNLGFIKKNSAIGYFELYKVLMKFPNNDFLIFNDSCYSGSMIDLIDSYNQIYDLKVSSEITEEINPQVLFSFMNLFKSVIKNKDITKVTELITFYQNIKEIDIDDVKNKVYLNENEVNLCEIIGLKKEDINNFYLIFNSYESIENSDSLLERYNKSREIFNENNMNIIQKLVNDDLNELIHTLECLYPCRKTIDFVLPSHKNIEIISSTDSKSICFPFTSIRINEMTKVNPGSPAMSSFIKEVFMKNDGTPINFDQIKKEISGSDENPIFYPSKVDQKPNERMKREWIRLSPQHYKPNKEMNFSFDVNEDIKLKIGALRGISYSINEKLKEIATFLTPDIDSYDLNQLNDPIADIVAITAILYKSNNIAQLIKSCIDKNDTFILHKPFKIETISLIVKSSFYFSKNPIDLNIAILNCLLAAIRISINQFIPLINENKESLMKMFTSEEIDELTGKTINKQIGKDSKDISNDMINNKKVDFLSKIENAVFVLLNPASVLFASVIATSITKQFNMAKIKKFDFGTKSIQEEITKIADENTINNNCECLLLTEAKNSLHHLNLICDAFIMNDIMKIVANKLHYFSALSFLRLLMENLEDTQNKLLIEEFIGQNDEMEKELIQNNISIFYIPVIFAFLPEKVIIYALYASISSKQMNWYAEFSKMLESIKNKVNEKLYEDIVGMSKFELKNQENIKDSSENDKFVDYMRNEIKKEQKIAISKATKLIDMSIKKARDSIIKRMNIDILSDQINEYYDFLSLVPQNKYDNKFHKYLYSSITKLTEVKNTYKITPRCEKCEKDEKGKIILDKLEEDINNFKRRASNELFVVSELFNISKKSLRDFNSKLSKKIDLKSIFNFSACSMLARSLNIVEMAPITDLLENYKNIFNEQDGENPDIKEIMGLYAANIYILSDKDKKRKRFITKNEDYENNKEDENVEDDTYYSDDYIEENYSFPIRLLHSESKDEKIISSDDSPKLSPFSNFNYHKDQLVGTEIESIREDLNLKQGNWTCEVWTAFLYCFNKRMKNIGIQFDPENDYKDAKYPVTIGEAILIVEQFFPLNRIHDFWRNEEKIKLFVGKYANHSREILRAIVRGFDDADRIVTPIHMFHETYQERTPEKLNLIFDY